ncbi:MAG: low molecular weight phosphotyrosine protein phosphatase [Leptolyngbyaceae cyanobacterium SM2_3_12]|nr:low molecular weight phosphotyrosine protein phosphatase [Leptolyngbyaceae cyanobacterium SM2_3_12]
MGTRVLFVCLGNICRSPSAENIMNHLIQQRQLTEQITCDSAGTSSYHIGSSPDRRMALAAKSYGFDLKGHARQLTPEDLEGFDWILAMDHQNYRDILSLDPSQQYAHKVKLMGDYCRNHSDSDVPDPYYGGGDGFNYVIELLTDACEGLLESILESPVAVRCTEP